VMSRRRISVSIVRTGFAYACDGTMICVPGPANRAVASAAVRPARPNAGRHRCVLMANRNPSGDSVAVSGEGARRLSRADLLFLFHRRGVGLHAQRRKRGADPAGAKVIGTGQDDMAEQGVAAHFGLMATTAIGGRRQVNKGKSALRWSSRAGNGVWTTRATSGRQRCG